MSGSNPGNFNFLWIFAIVLGITIAALLLRGFGILTFIPGGVFFLLLLLCIVTGILGYLQSTRW